jgi:hypothetical protein
VFFWTLGLCGLQWNQPCARRTTGCHSVRKLHHSNTVTTKSIHTDLWCQTQAKSCHARGHTVLNNSDCDWFVRKLNKPLCEVMHELRSTVTTAVGTTHSRSYCRKGQTVRDADTNPWPCTCKHVHARVHACAHTHTHILVPSHSSSTEMPASQYGST